MNPEIHFTGYFNCPTSRQGIGNRQDQGPCLLDSQAAESLGMGHVPEVDGDPFFLFAPHRIAVHLDNHEWDLGFSQHLRQITPINPIAGDDRMVPQTDRWLLNKP